MAIPGLKPVYEVRGKIRVGTKGSVVKNGKTVEFPKSQDFFSCDEVPEFAAALGKPKRLSISFLFEKPEDNFSTGLEQWEGQMLVCYSKGETMGVHPYALRKETMKKKGGTIDLLRDFTVLSPETVGNDRKRVWCKSRECPMMKNKSCKPMGRLMFTVLGVDGIFQIDTKAWNSIERIEGTLAQAGDPRGKQFELKVTMEQSGTKKFPVITLERGEEVIVDSPKDAAIADAGIQLRKALETPELIDPLRFGLAALLDLTTPAWRDNPALVEKLKQVGVKAAAESMLEKLNL